MKCAVGFCGHCQFGPTFMCKEGPVYRFDQVESTLLDPGVLNMSAKPKRPKLAVWKFSSCDGCQLSLLDCEDKLLDVAGAFEIAYFLEASRAVVRGPYDLSLVEGSIATPHDVRRIHEVRAKSRIARDHRRLRDRRAASRPCETSAMSRRV